VIQQAACRAQTGSLDAAENANWSPNEGEPGREKRTLGLLRARDRTANNSSKSTNTTSTKRPNTALARFRSVVRIRVEQRGPIRAGAKLGFSSEQPARAVARHAGLGRRLKHVTAAFGERLF
jgi:hypothetical protein